jgi:hypothetical protein
LYFNPLILLDPKSLKYLRGVGFVGRLEFGDPRSKLGLISVYDLLFLAVCRLLEMEGAISSDRSQDCWPAPGSEDTELGVLMEPEVDHGTSEVYTRVQA